MVWLALGLGAWIGGWWLNTVLADRPRSTFTQLAVPVIFGLTIIVIWQSAVRGFDISKVLLPAPTDIAIAFASLS